MPSVPRPGRTTHGWLTVSLQAVMALGGFLSALQAQWMTAFVILCILCLTALPLVLERRFDVFIPPEFELAAVVVVFASLFLGWIHGYYLRFPWWDTALHAASGLLLGVLGFLLVYVLNQDEKVDVHMRPGFVAFFAFTFALAAGAVWEIFEFAMDRLFDARMQMFGLADTMWDLVVDAAGGLVVALLGYAWMRGEIDSPLERWIDDFARRNPGIFPGTGEPEGTMERGVKRGAGEGDGGGG